MILGAVGTVDWWAPAAGEAWLGGVSHARRTTEPGRAVSWDGLLWEGDGVRLRVDSLRVAAPSRLLRGEKFTAEGRGWVLEILERRGEPAPDEGEAGAEGAWETWVPRLREVGGQLGRRVGEVRLREGVVKVAGEEIAVEKLELIGEALRVTARARGRTAEVAMNLKTGLVEAVWVEGGVRISGLVGASLARATLEWEGNRAEVEAKFAAGEWWPAEVGVRGEDWSVPAEKLGLGERGYEDLEGGFTLRGEGRRFSGTMDAMARPKTAELPTVRVQAAASGDPAGVKVERLELEAPQAKARLSAPIEWRRDAGWVVEGAPVFAWEADLGALSDGELRGRAEGTARWTEDRVRWEAKGAALAWRHIAGATLTVRGETDADATTVAEAVLDAGEGSRVEAGGRFVHTTRAVEGGVLRAKTTGALLAPWLPEGAALERAEADLRVEGAWPAPKIEGVVRVEKPEAAGWAAELAEARVAGAPGAKLRGELTASRGEAKLATSGEWTPETATVDEFSLRRADGAVLRATKPARARLAAGSRRVEAELAGPGETRASVVWDEGGETSVLIQNMDTSWARDWRVGAAPPELELRRLAASTRVADDGVLEGEGDFELAGRAGADVVRARGKARFGREGARLEELEAGTEDTRGGVLVEGAGLLPWRARRSAGWAWEPVEGGRWDLRLQSRAGAEWWDELAKLAGVELVGPTLRLSVEGEVGAPRGGLALGAEQIRLRGEGLPEGGLELVGLQAEAELTREALVVRRLEASVDGQKVEAEGRLALAKGDWARLRERPYVWLRDHAEARVRVPGAEVAAFARYLPTLLAPQGRVTADLRLTPGAKLEGEVGLSGAATRPLGGFGVLQEVEVKLALSGMDVWIETMRATAGGQALTVTGGARRVPGGMPALDLAVKAERFPLLRKPGLLLRGDLDLTVRTAPDDGRTKVGGEVRLRDSLFLADIRPLLAPGGGRGAAAVRARPPYFSVDTPPLADWELGLRVGGESFLRLRTPVFEGTGSARFDLTGTLREPRATGEFWVERGNILFPFASFAVQEGAVRLKASDPYTPALDFRATGRRLGYDLRLELGGTADAPQLQITSSPPLDAETVLLMVTAGAAPAEGVGASSGTQRLAAVGAYVGRDLLRTLGVGGTDEERLTVNSGEKVSRAGRETYGFEFKLNEKWSLTGEYDEFDAYNVGVRRRFGPRPPEEKPEMETREPQGAAADDGKDADNAR